MLRIKIGDLPRDVKISREEMRSVIGGTFFVSPVPFYVQGSSKGTYVKYASSMEGAGYQEDLVGLEASKHDTQKQMWSDDD